MNKLLSIKIAAAVISVALLSVNCGGGQVQEENVNTRGVGIDQINSALRDLSYSPYGKGFEYKSTAVPAEDFKSWFTKFSPQINQAISAVGSGFVLQVTGHTCSRGPREAVPAENKLGNMYYSRTRAQNVYNALVNAGIDGKNMTVVGVADDETLPGIDTTDQRNRRVTFKIVPAPAK